MIKVSSVKTARAVASNESVWKLRGERLHSQPEDARNLVEVQSEEVFDLRAGDQNGDAVGEADDDRPRDELHRGAHAGDAHDDQQTRRP